MPQPQQPSWIASWLAPLFDAIGLNGADRLVASRTPPPPVTPILTEKDLRDLGYSEQDIKVVLGQQRQRK